MKSKKIVKKSLESSIKRLEEIVETLERGETSLDDAVVLYEEGIQISKECAEKLKATELKIKKLSHEVEGDVTLNESERE